MFLNETRSKDQYFETPKLIDQDVDYYGFLKSKEYKNIEDYVMQYMPMDVYDSPYFGLGSGAYREMDRVYEAYKSELPIDILQPDPNVKRVTTTSAGTSPALILAAAAAFFFAG